MNYEEIKKLLNDMGNSKIDELQIEFPEGVKISMKKNTVIDKDSAQQENHYKQKIVNYVSANCNEMDKTKEEGNLVNSPMVGTFYSKSSPKAEPFVKVGDKVKKGDILCIIEAMKLMNEIESEYDGEIVEIFVEDENMVEYGQPLMRIK